MSQLEEGKKTQRPKNIEFMSSVTQNEPQQDTKHHTSQLSLEALIKYPIMVLGHNTEHFNRQLTCHKSALTIHFRSPSFSP